MNSDVKREENTMTQQAAAEKAAVKKADQIKNLPPADEAPEDETLKLRQRLRRSERSVINYQYFIFRLVFFLIVVWVLFFKIIGITRMPNGDMYPRLDAGDLVLYYRLDKEVRSQDVIVLEKTTPDSNGEKQIFVLRVVGAPGDTVEVTEGDRLVVNGNSVLESNIFYPTPRYESEVSYPVKLAEDECFVLADSRNGGNDSRFFGPVKTGEIIGSVITILRRNNL